MALFKIHKGTEKNNDGTSKLPQSYVEGYAYFATDTGRFYIDTTDQASGRKMINPDAIINITRNGTTFTATKVDGSTITFTQQDNNTTYSAGIGLTLSGTTFSTNNNRVFMFYDRNDIGTSPNYDDPGVNGHFELRHSSEVTGETGIKPFDNFGSFISIKNSNTMFQLAGSNNSGFYIRGKQSGNVTLSGVSWQEILTDNNYTAYTVTKTGGGASGTWGINVSGSAAKLTTSRTIALTGDVIGSGSFNGSANLSITTAVADNSHNHITANISDLKFAICGDNLLSQDKIVNRGLTSFTYDTTTQIYTCVAPINSDTWGFGITFSHVGRKIFIPRGKTIYFSLEVYPTIACTWNQDTNNQFASGTTSSSNDNDVSRSSNSRSLEANKWQRCWFSYTAPADRDLIDANSNWGIVTTDLATETTFYLRNIQAQIGDIPTAFQTPTLSIATTSNTSSGTIYLLGVTNNTSGELQYNGNIYMNGSNGTITAKGFNGNATSASKLATARAISLTGSVTGSGSFDGSGNLSIATTTNHSHSYLPLSGGTMTGTIYNNSRYTYTGPGAVIDSLTSSNFITGCAIDVGMSGSGIYKGNGDGTSTGTTGVANLIIKSWYGVGFATSCYNVTNQGITLSINTRTGDLNTIGKIYGAVWNDYAEYRSQNEIIEPGYIAYCDDDGKLKKTTERLQKFEGVVSDTFGFAIGETDDCKTPLAVSGRVLVYCDPEDHFHSGDCVCAGPGGLAYRMTREEIAIYPDRIVGIVSEIPTYERWGSGDVEVNGRIWIKVR